MNNPFEDKTNSEIIGLINEYIHSERDRNIMKRRLVDGICFEPFRYKDTNRTLADMYYNLSVAEMDHVSMLHDAGVRLINEYSAEHEVPEGMKAIYDYLHERHIKWANKIRGKQEGYRK